MSRAEVRHETPIARHRLSVTGVVQGVGFRPFVYRLATELGLAGFVRNSSHGVIIEIEGPKPALIQFARRLIAEAPPAAWVERVEVEEQPPKGESAFHIQKSDGSGPPVVLVLPDLATCPQCLAELFDPADRRYRYPFINCTNCGPRYSIIRQLPYDRPNTTMAHFTMCPDCRAEYENPADRRFHAQPNACAACGPGIALWDRSGRKLAEGDAALRAAAEEIRHGRIVAVKGLGGFHLMVDAGNAQAVSELRRRKRRGDKAFAVMFPSMGHIEESCFLSAEERAVLGSPAAPIVLLRRRPGVHRVCSEVAPNLDTIGAFLPYTPLHHLLLRELGIPVVATSGNLSDEPICIDEMEALQRLKGVADCFLIHNRPIQRPVDDSVVHVVHGRAQLLRRSRGYAPLPVFLKRPAPTPVLALGGHQKATVALAVGHRVFLSQHIGDLESVKAVEFLERTAQDLCALYQVRPGVLACDLHPDYHSTHVAEAWAAVWEIPLVRVQHHLAHALSCMAEHGLEPPVLAVVWDGTGYGPDGTVWGGEFLEITGSGFVRRGHLYPFPLLGGERAIREPRRSALGLLREAAAHLPIPDAAWERAWAPFPPEVRAVLAPILSGPRPGVWTTSAGRLFDGVASLLGVRHLDSYEGQAAMELESMARRGAREGLHPLAYRLILADNGRWLVDWRPMLADLLDRMERGVNRAELAYGFHLTLAQAIRDLAVRIGVPTVVLSGGCFQNRLLTEQTVASLQEVGLEVYIHEKVPPNDGGLALGQTFAVVYGIHRQEEGDSQPASPAKAG